MQSFFLLVALFFTSISETWTKETPILTCGSTVEDPVQIHLPISQTGKYKRGKTETSFLLDNEKLTKN